MKKTYQYLFVMICFTAFLWFVPSSLVKADGFRVDHGFRWNGLICAGERNSGGYIHIYGYKGEETTIRIPKKMKRGIVKYLHSVGKCHSFRKYISPMELISRTLKK